MSLDYRIKSRRMKAVIGMYLAAADADTFYIEKDLVVLQVCRRQIRDISEFELLWL